MDVEPKRSLPELVAAMLAGDAGAASEFVQRQKLESLDALMDGARRLTNSLHALQLRDPDAFMRAKYPDPLPTIDGETFRRALDAAILGDDEQVHATLLPLPLPELFAVNSLGHRLRLACAARLRSGPADRLLEPSQSAGSHTVDDVT